MRYLRNVTTLELNTEACTGCGRCVEVCPHAVLELSGSKARIRDLDACMECGACMRNCAFNALQVEAGVGCAAAIIGGALSGGEPTCGCGCGPSESGSCC